VPASAEERRTPRTRGFRRLVGIDRSGPRPAQTRKGEPLRPWTLPNLIGYLRLAAIPVFLVLAFDSGDGRSAAAGALYLFITAGDYVDGFIARATGQYSRLGALLDPAIDRLAALAGAAVCWHFELLPRWSLVALVVRELATVALARLALRRGLDLEISWVGRFATTATFGGLFLTLVVESWATEALFFAGLVLGVYATVLYALAGMRALSGPGGESTIPGKRSTST
jgi:cardiolipin synthase (CMP-forming)